VHPTPGRAPGLYWWERRVFEQFSWLEVGSVKMALSRPAHQPVTHAVGRQPIITLSNLVSRPERS